jgi:hypothetical protein
MSRSLWRLWWICLASCTEFPNVAPWTIDATDAGEAASDAAVRGAASEHITPAVVRADASVARDATTQSDTAPDPLAEACAPSARAMPRVPSRRLSRVEYNNTIRDLLGDTSSPGNSLPSEPIGNSFGNDASKQSISSLLAEQYGSVAAAVATRATGTPEQVARLAPCVAQLTADNELACAQTSIERLARRAYRRPLASGEADELVALWQITRDTSDFKTGLAQVIEALLQSPDFLYRIELGEPDPANPTMQRLTGFEMATRLSYMYWGTMPDEALLQAAEAGQLTDRDSIRAQAERLLDTRERSRAVLRFFFDSLLPISGLSSLKRDSAIFPTLTPAIGALLREETQQYLEREILDESASWPQILTRPYSYLNEPLAAFYGIEGVSGNDFQRVSLDSSQRLGLLTQAGVLAGTTHSNITSPVLRGSFVVQRLMCRTIPLPTGAILAKIKPPEPSSGKTGRERYAAHTAEPVCRSCHQFMDPVGFALENYDAIGMFRTQENGATIDPAGKMPDSQGGELAFDDAVGMARALAGSEDVTDCFATNWMSFAYGRSPSELDACSAATLKHAFQLSDYSVRTLLLELTQTDAFLYLAKSEDSSDE